MRNKRDSLSPIGVVGEVLRETIVPVTTLPSERETVVYRRRESPLGGAAVNVAWYLAQTGRAVELVGAAGTDDYNELRTMFLGLPCSLDRLIRTDQPTDSLVTLLTRDTHISTYELSSRPTQAVSQFLAGSSSTRSLVLNGGRHPGLRKLYREIVQSERYEQLAFNPSYAIYEYTAAELKDIIGGVQVVIMNQDEADYLHRSLTTSIIPREAYVITMAEKGAKRVFPKPTKHYLAPAVKPGIYLGAGDAFIAGFLGSYWQHRDADRGIRIAMEVARQVVEQDKIRADLRLESGH